MTPQPSEQPTRPFYWAGCPICGSEHVMRLRDDWQAQVASGAAIPIVGCGNPWHYFLDRVAAAPDPVASPAEAVRLLRELVACLSTATPVRGDLAQILAEARRFLEGAVASPLDVERLARALIGSDLMPRYHEYAMRVPTMNPSETVEHLAAVWAGWVAAAYEAEGQPVAEGRRHDPSDHDCRGGVRGDLFPQGQPAAEEPR